MRQICAFILLYATVLCCSEATAQNDPVMLKTANGHPMQYFISLPEGWTKQKTWPVVFVIESADKEYRENALRFVRARKHMPFIIVAPYNVNNSRSGRRDPAVFPYSAKDWDYIERVGDCTFNMEGLTQIAKDVHEQYNSEEQYYITGFEAGTHTVWQMVFQHPERLKAAIPVAGNYNQNSCMTPALFSAHPSRVNLPVIGFSAAKDSIYGPEGRIYSQWLNAKIAAQEHGYKNVSAKTIPAKGHEPMPVEVMEEFNALLPASQKR